MFPSITQLYIMKDISNNYYLNEISKLKKENEKLKINNTDLKDRLEWVIVAKNEIYSNYIDCILKYCK